VQLPEFWHFLGFCHFSFSFESYFQRDPIGHSVAFVDGARMAMECPSRERELGGACGAPCTEAPQWRRHRKRVGGM
jgi:hypothetical protein